MMNVTEDQVYTLVQELINFPGQKICKHHVALMVIDTVFDENNQPEQLVESIVWNNDEKTLNLLESKYGVLR